MAFTVAGPCQVAAVPEVAVKICPVVGAVALLTFTVVEALAKACVMPDVKPVAVPVMLVPTRAEGVPNAGVTRVGEVLKTTFPVPVDVVTPVPPFATANVPAIVMTPLVVTGPPLKVRPVVPPLTSTLVTVPENVGLCQVAVVPEVAVKI